MGDSDDIEDIDEVNSQGLHETFWVSSYPYSVADYWRCMRRLGIDISISLATFTHRLESLPENIKMVKKETQGEVTQMTYSLITKEESRTFIRFEFPWPDYSIPDRDTFLLFMSAYELTLAKISSNRRPQVHVHCIGGHGRSGTLVFTRALMAAPIGAEPKTILAKLRKQRRKLVETEEQQEFAVELADRRK